MIKLALTDLDDTLIKNGMPHASDHALAAIHAMLDAGLRFGPVSGRIPKAMGWMFADDEACYATAALSNGQMIYVDGELVHVELLDGHELNRIAEVLSHIPRAVLAMYDVDAPVEDEAGYFVSPDPDHLALAHQTFGHIKRSAARLTEPAYVKANIWCAGSREHVTEVRDMEEQPGNILKNRRTGGLRAEDITEDFISRHLCTSFMPDPDLLIRTGGELRISNYLLWQIAYSELYFCDTYWPDFDEAELHKAIESYQHRQRRFGKTEEQVENEK